VSQAKIQILMGVYNGAKYLDAALESVCMQDSQDWSLLIRDDGSSDDTPNILLRWQQRLKEKLEIVPNPDRLNLGMNGNYSCLIAASRSRYVVPIAHDDLDHRGKLVLLLETMERHEARVGLDRPVLVYTDLRVINEDGDVVAPSHWRYIGWHPPTSKPLGRLLVHSGICGATCLLNRPLIEFLGDPPLCEDVWIGFVAAAFANVIPLMDQTVDFRWHTTNQSEQIAIGALVRQVLSKPWTARNILHGRLESLRPRARDFLEKYRNRLTPELIATLDAFLHLPEMGPLARRRAILRYGLLYPSWIRSLGMIVLI